MKDIKQYSVIDKEYKATTLIGIAVFIFFITAKWIFKIDLNLYSNPLSVIGLASAQIIVYAAAWIIIIFGVIRSYMIAKELGRNPILWSIAAIIATPLTLIIISNMGERYDSEEIRKIVNDCRDEYNIELAKVFNSHHISESEQKKQEQKLEIKYNVLLYDKLVSIQVETLVERIKLLIEQDIITSSVDIEKQRIILANDIRNNLNKCDLDSLVCPACSAIISEESVLCTECELTLNNVT